MVNLIIIIFSLPNILLYVKGFLSATPCLVEPYAYYEPNSYFLIPVNPFSQNTETTMEKKSMWEVLLVIIIIMGFEKGY